MRKLVIIIPAYDEEKGIAAVLDRIPRAMTGIGEIDVVVVDDGSTDKTGAIAGEKGAEVISHPYNLGLGVSFRRGIERALERGADLIVNIDADGQFEPEDIPKLVEPIVRGEAEVVTASRFKSPGFAPEMPRVKRLGNKFMSFIISRIVGQKFYDVSCGFMCFSKWGPFLCEIICYFCCEKR